SRWIRGSRPIWLAPATSRPRPTVNRRSRGRAKRGPVINQKPRRMGIRRGGSVPSGCHTKTGSHSDGTRAVRACRAGPTDRSVADAAAPGPAGAARGVLGPPVSEGAGDYDRETPAAGPYVARRARPADARDATAARPVDRAGP